MNKRKSSISLPVKRKNQKDQNGGHLARWNEIKQVNPRGGKNGI